MAFLDSKDRILDIVLTDHGRELMAKNQLNFKYYAFSDEGIDYSGSLSASFAVSSSMDNYIHRDLSFEADQRKNRDLSSFLYTINPGSRVLPEFRTSIDTDVSVTLDRKFYMDTIILENRPTTIIGTPVDVVLRGTTPRRTYAQREKDYVLEQKSKSLLSFLGVKEAKK